MTLSYPFRISGCTGPNTYDLFYVENGGSRNGCSYILLREDDHTDQDVAEAKHWLRQNLDVINITVVNMSDIKQNS